MPRSKTPEPSRDREAAVTKTAPRQGNRAQMHTTNPATSLSNRLPTRVAKSENDLSAQRKATKSKETLSKEDRLALSYNAYLQSCLMAVHDAEVRERKEKEVVAIMENQQLELMALEEENNYLDMVLMKIKLYKQMKEDVQKKTEICQQIIG